mgnify:CR=1 FL=1|tara:strand:- start:3092 stop:4138 length:1047 start_codon:yes stop_codon:yes gene_type:complete
MNILITGGAGFIGSHLVRRFVSVYPNYNVYNMDILTYAGNLENLRDVQTSKNYKFLYGDISDQSFVNEMFQKYKFEGVINLAAESHVDRSILNPNSFAKTNILGTINLMNSFIELWKNNWKNKKFYQISTDEVYGSLGETGFFTETSPYNPNSPYSASKASADHFVRSYGETFNMPFLISNCSNNYGQNQFPEKLIPLFINNIINNKPLPVYGDGNYTRDWLYVKDHVLAIDLIFHKGKNKETYNIGGFNEWKNIDLAETLCKILDNKLGNKINSSKKLIRFVKDRPGHDLRYAIDASKINNTLDWHPSLSFEEGLSITVDWYLSNLEWLNSIKSGNYITYNDKHKYN